VYGVVICPKCRRPQGVRLEAKTASCQCGKRLYIQRLKVLVTMDSARDLPGAVGRVRAQMAGQLEEVEEALTEGARRVSSGPGAVSRSSYEKALETLRSLSEGEGFQVSQAEKVLSSLGLPATEVVEALIREGLIYEVRRGRFKVV
jgi:hypothetical protein